MDIPNRDELERELARKLSRLLAGDMGRLIELMGDPPSLDSVPAAFWDEAGQELRLVLAPFLQRVYLEQAGRIISSTGIGMDWAMANQNAIDWVSRYSFRLVGGIEQTSRRTIQRALTSYFRDGLTIGDLQKLIAPTFGPVRAEMIAITEVTRAAARGEDMIVRELEKAGIRMITRWNTNNDELVCTVCGPLHGTEAAGRDGEDDEPYWMHPELGIKVYMPAHPRCRCNENNELPKLARRPVRERVVA